MLEKLQYVIPLALLLVIVVVQDWPVLKLNIAVLPAAALPAKALVRAGEIAPYT